MEDLFFKTKTEPVKEESGGKTNISDLFKKQEYQDTLLDMKEMLRPIDIVGKAIVITDYKEDTMPDTYSKDNIEKSCFRMDFYFEKDEVNKTKHFIRTDAKYLWDYLKTVDRIDPQLLRSGEVTATILRGEKKKKGGGFPTPFYYFAGTVDEKDIK